MQYKEEESNLGIPSDEWLDSSKVYNSKRKHLELLELLNQSYSLVLDAGCSAGTYGLILAERSNVVGVDISKVAVDKANERASYKNISFRAYEGDLESLDFEDNYFSVVFVGWTLHHFPNLEKVCSELTRVLKPNGLIAIVEPNEANLLMRCSRFVEDSLRGFVLKIGWDTPNRTIHTHKDYIEQLKKLGYKDIEYSSCYANLPPILNSKNILMNFVLEIVYGIRAFLFETSSRILAKPMNGADLIIMGKKGE